jgi:hypothetical protein
MPLKEAIEFLKGAVDRSASGVATPAVYSFHEGWAYARGGALLAGHPVPQILGTFGLAAADLDAALARMRVEPAIEAGDGAIVLRSGRLRSSIDLFEVFPPEIAEPAGEPLPEGLLSALEKARPFVGHEGTWQRGIELRTGFVRAVTNVAGVRVDVPGLVVDAPTALSDEVVAYLVARDPPAAWAREPGRVTFTWLGGAFARCQLMSYPWPRLVDELFAATADVATPVAIDDAFRDAVADLAALGDDHLDLGPDGLVGKSAHATHAVDLPVAVAEVSRWRIAALKNVVAAATSWAPTPASPAAFAAPGVRGMVSPLRITGR